jgi:hypothetical protein
LTRIKEAGAHGRSLQEGAMAAHRNEVTMFDLKVGQELEFIWPVDVEGRAIAQGTRVRVGAIMAEFMEPDVTLVMLGDESPGTLTVAKHFVIRNCRPVA